ncbi:MAG: S26 family signal peptidase [Geodermatophilaceae bacterium]|nr:S26 family signal peptidase [Geodermatophilaceae bacterium]MDQ3466506.1 S26 family signal peptidase [Actinomycetota bacterium]
MVPALYSGDQLLVRRTDVVRGGDLIVATFTGAPDRLVVKRAVRRVAGGWWVVGDNPAGSDDSRRYGPAEVVGRVMWRYWPLVRRAS